MTEATANRITSWLGFGIVAIVVAYAAEVRELLELDILNESGIATALGIALAIVFLKYPVKSGQSRDRVPIYDILLAILALVVGCWLAFRFALISSEFFERREEAFYIALVAVPIIFEGLRRSAGIPLVCILGAFLIYALWGDLIPGDLQARSPGFFKLFAYLVGDNVALLGLPLTIVTTIVVMFIVMGQLLASSGGSEWFTDMAMSVMGKRRGGPAKIAILASALFGSISGSAVSNVASTGVITIPLMKKAGYRSVSAGAFEAVASTGGQIMPPIMGAAAFLIAEFLEIAYSEVILAALIPSILYYISVFVQADLEAAQHGLKALDDDQFEPLGKVFSRGWFFILPFVVLLVSLFNFNRTASEAAAWACVVLLVVGIKGYKGHKLNFPNIITACKSAGQTSVSIIIIGAMAGLIIGIVEVTGLGFGLTFILVQIGEHSLVLLLILTAIVSIILGMGMPTTAIYFLVAVLAAPPLIKLGIEPLAAHLFVLYYGLLSMITPPVAIAAFTAANLSGASPMATAVKSVRYGWPAFVLPFVFVFSPAMIMQGTALEITRITIAACIGIWLASAGISGYLNKPLGVISRVLLIGSGIALLFPGSTIGVNWLDIVGFIVGTVVVAQQYFAARQTA